MDLELKKSGKGSVLLFCLLSFVAGGINGFLGTGGGIIFVYMLSLLTKNDKKDNFATTLCAVIPISIISLFAYSKGGNIDTDMIKTLIPSAILGGALGGFLTDKIKTKYLSICFSALVIYSGVCMVM
ncbi:MAG: sulfite exporter TauE/SafE family protein [Clostridia bacterium]|nr:sulfite exporter TauE/SafE family protein [Clostridia bacterium]